MQNIFQKCAVSLALCLTGMQVLCLPVSAESKIIPDFSYLGTAGSLTLEQTQEIASAVYEGIANHDETILIYVGRNNFTVEKIQEVMNVYRTVVSTWDVGILTSRQTVTYQVSTNGTLRIKPNYLEEDINYDIVYAEMMQKLDEIVSEVDDNWSDAEKALYLHDYLAVYYDYDYTDYTNATDTELKHTAYGMLKKNTAVCEGYAWLYNILLQRVGVNSAIVESNEISHAWNLLYINQAWYHVDVTWDDAYYQHAGLVYHSNFLKTNEEFTETNHSSTDWQLSTGTSVFELRISDLYSNSFWNQCNSAIQYYQNQWFAIHCDSANNQTTAWFDLCNFDSETGTAEITHLNSLDARWSRWYVFDNESYYYSGTYVTPVIVNDVLYYTTPTDVFAWKDNAVIWLFGLSEEQKQQGYIYGMYAEGNQLYYQVSTSPTDEPKIYSYALWEKVPEETTNHTTEAVTTTATSTTTISATTTSATTTSATTTSATTTSTTTTSTTTTSTTIASTTTTGTSVITTVEPAVITLYGDIDSDGMISLQDVILLRRYLSGKESFTKDNYLRADSSQDGIVNIYDFVITKQMLLQ